MPYGSWLATIHITLVWKTLNRFVLALLALIHVSHILKVRCDALLRLELRASRMSDAVIGRVCIEVMFIFALLMVPWPNGRGLKPWGVVASCKSEQTS